MSPVMGDSLRRRRRGDPLPSRVPDQPRGGTRWVHWLGAGLVVTGLMFLAGWLIALFVLFPPPPPPGDTVSVPQLVGRSLVDAERILAEAGLVLEEATEMPHGSQPQGVVLAQSPLAGMQLMPGAAVRVGVSAGRARARVPDLTGLPGTGAMTILTRAGFHVELEEEVSAEPAGHVLRSNPPPGGEHELPARITLYVSAGMPGATVDTLLGDSLGANAIPGDVDPSIPGAGNLLPGAAGPDGPDVTGGVPPAAPVPADPSAQPPAPGVPVTPAPGAQPVPEATPGRVQVEIIRGGGQGTPARPAPDPAPAGDPSAPPGRETP